MQSDDNWTNTLDTLVNGKVPQIPAHEVFIQTPRGAAVAGSRRAELPDRLRTLLFLINGRRRMFEYRDLLPRYRNIDDTFDMLTRKGYIEPLSGSHRPG